MTILHFSDTHGQHRRLTNLPDADIIVHSGDFTMNGSKQEAIDFLNCFCDLPYPPQDFHLRQSRCLSIRSQDRRVG